MRRRLCPLGWAVVHRVDPDDACNETGGNRDDTREGQAFLRVVQGLQLVGNGSLFFESDRAI
jgi:hypothetical protein